MRPLIAVVGRQLPADRIEGRQQPHLVSPLNQLDALERAGATTAVLRQRAFETAAASEVLARFDGLLLPGGDDIDAAFFGEEPHPELRHVDTEADAFELALTRAAVADGIPTLALCRGIQVLNVALGGSLDQHITGREGLVDHGLPYGGVSMHDVRVASDSKLGRALGVTTISGSSHHHQAVGRLGDGLTPVAWAPDGIIEGLELDDGWIVGVQWHPEDTAGTDPDQQRLFEAFVEQAATSVQRR